jgi:periplasmic protein TonB
MKTTLYIFTLLLLTQMAFAQAEKAPIPPPIILEEPIREDGGCHILLMGELKPEFPGGEKALMQYLADNIKYPAVDDSEPITGSKIFIQFTIEKDGSVANVKVMRGIHRIYDEVAANVVRAMPKWSPAKQNGRPVCVTYTLPVSIRLE